MKSLLASLIVAMSLVGCARSLPPNVAPDGQVKAVTADGWVLPLRHYAGPGAPVLLVHGMGANHYNWDYRDEVSLAVYLQEEGFDVWVPELRGDPGARPPSRAAARSFSFDAHADYDLPAVVDAVREVTGADQVAWVGHSMGGMLLYTALVRYPEKISAGVAVCSPGELTTLGPLQRSVRGLGWAVRGDGLIRSTGLVKLVAPLGRANPLYGKLANRANLDYPVANGLARHALVDMTRPMARQATTWVKRRTIVREDGTPWFPTLDAQVPTLLLGGSVDKIVPEPNVAATCARMADCTYQVLGTAGGLSTEYGHVDPIVGRTARDEVYPLIGSFLAGHVVRP